MALNGFTLGLVTGSDPGADTDGDVYLGLGGREFYVDRVSDHDFESGYQSFFFGAVAANATGDNRPIAPEFNDPRNPFLEEPDVLKYPVYLRFVPKQMQYGPNRDDNWQLKKAELFLHVDFQLTGLEPIPMERRDGTPGPNMVITGPMWFGIRRGQIRYFRRPDIAQPDDD